MKYRRILILGAITLLVAGIGAAVLQHTHYAPARAVHAYPDRPRFDAPKSVPGLHLDDKSADSEYQLGLRKYDASDFTAATMGFYKATATEPEAPAPHFYLGICYLMTGDVRVAIRELRIVATLKDSPFQEPAHFYLAKAYLRQGDSVNAARELDLVMKGNGQMKPQAEELKLKLMAN